MPALRFNTSIVTGTLNAVSGTSVTGGTVHTGGRYPKIEDLSAYVILTAATASITVTPYWQVSNDDTTYATLRNAPAGTAGLPAVTGTANATVAVPAPEGVTGYRYARCMLLVGGATGAAGDLYSVGYSYRQLR